MIKEDDAVIPPSFSNGLGGYIPTYATPHSACFDFYCPHFVRLTPGEITKIPLGLALWPGSRERFILQIKDRSSLALRGLEIKGGIIDVDYEGEIILLMKNTMQWTETIQIKDRVAQGFWTKVETAPYIPTIETKRAGGFGSTGA